MNLALVLIPMGSPSPTNNPAVWAERAALELVATRSNALVVASSEELERVLSALSDVTYLTADNGVSE